MRLELDGFTLRPWRRGDERALARHADNRNIWRTLRDRFPHPYTIADAEEWIGRTLAEGAPPRNFAIALEDRPVGGAGIELGTDVHRHTAEVGYWVAEPYWGRGLATGALARLTDYAFGHFDLVRLEAAVFEGNGASCRVLEKAGYRFEARLADSVFKDGRLLDTRLYVRLRDGGGRAPGPPGRP